MNQNDRSDLDRCFKFLSSESNESNYVNEVAEFPSSVKFLRENVSPNRPLIIRRGVEHWPAVKLWKNWDYLKAKIGNKQVTVAVTSNGLADAVYEGNFVMPYEEMMDMSKLIDILSGSVDYDGIVYIQKQNSNLLEEFSDLLSDVDKDIKWASEALGNEPDAVNFWMGDSRAVTSLHKDHYENIYCVISGYKDFILYRPTDLPWIPYESFPSAKFEKNDQGNFYVKLLEESSKVPWIPLDPLKPNVDKYPLYENATPIHCRIEAGDVLYLPSLWFHHVRQSHGCIAVNYWYDMDFDIKYNYYKFVEMLTNLK
ncbi:hypothetical protein CHUAL_006371 [Chamberlinius hualienensis]